MRDPFRDPSEDPLQHEVTFACMILIVVPQMRRMEMHSHETEKILLLTRALIGRLMNVGAVGVKYYLALYCPKIDKTCTFCAEESDGQKDPCWEDAFGIQLIM